MPFIQYPWRWLEAVEAPLGLFFVAAIWPAARRARIAVVAMCALGFIGAVVYADRNYFQACYPEDAVPSMDASYRAGAGFDGMFEYAPPGSDISTIARGLPDACLVTDPDTELGHPDPDDPDANPIWTRDHSSCAATFSWDGGPARNPEHLRIIGTAPQAGYLVLKLLAFPAWRAELNGGPLYTDRANALHTRPDGLVAILVQRGPIRLTIDWTTTSDVGLGRLVSGISVLIAIVLAWLERRLARAGRY
jgi:hypothetical protein